MRTLARTRVALPIAVAAAVACSLPAVASATSYSPDTTQDLVADDGHCSLREAVIAASSNSASGASAGECAAGGTGPGDSITLGATTYELTLDGAGDTGGDLDLSGGVDFAGAGASATTILQKANDRVIELASGSSSISGLAVAGGDGVDGAAVGLNVNGNPGANGGGIATAAGSTLALTDAIVRNNHAGDGGSAGSADVSPTAGPSGGAGGKGGGVYSAGKMTLTRTRVIANSSGTGSAGVNKFGAFGSFPSSGSGGAGGHGGDGGGVWSGSADTSDLAVVDSTISGNAAGAGGSGGQGVGGNASGGAFGPASGGAGSGGFGADGGEGGGINAGAGTVSSTTISGNTGGAGGQGGAAQGGNGSSGTAAGLPGAGGGSAAGAAGGSGGTGGLSVSGAFQLGNATVSANTAGGGGNGAAATGGNGGAAGPPGSAPNNMPSGGAGGNATSGQGGAAGHGGVTTQGTVTITNATITANDASAPGSGASANGGQGGAGSGGGTSGSNGAVTIGPGGDPAGEGVRRAGGPLTISNSIVAGNPKGNCSGGPADGGHNVTFGTGPCPGTVADPKLGALADNGGATATHRPGPGSAALDIVPGSGSNCPTTDQRGAARPRGPGCEAGAVEIAPPVALTGAASGVSTAAATLGGTVNAVGLPGTYHFDYGTTGAYGTSTLDGTLAAGTGATPASAPITGLAADTQYHFRVVVTTIDGTALGDDHTFRTAAVDTGNPQDTVAPVLSAVSLTNKIFAVNPKGAAEISAAKAKAKKPKLGTALRFTLSEAARVVFTIQRASVGRTVGTSCVKATKANAKKKHCRLLTPAGRFAANAVAGANTKTFSGRIGKRSLSPGSYRFVLVATDAAGNASKPVTATFRVVKK